MTGSLPETVQWRGDSATGALWLLDQTLLPATVEVLELTASTAVIDAIQRLAVRGAPAIGVAAAYGLVLAVRERLASGVAFTAGLAEQVERLALARPTAVNLRWALDRCAARAATEPTLDALLDEARAIHQEDRDACDAMGRFGSELVPDGGTVLTHCNAGRLATAGDGTALAVLYAAWRAGKRFTVLADETRPLLQGARLTALELHRAGIPVEVICDSAAAGLIGRGEVQMVITGADRIAANGDVANKVGTYGLALAANAHEVPFYVAAPRSTFDLALPDGAVIPIEERDAIEVTGIGNRPIAPPGIGARNPAFDRTPAALIAALVTDVGVLRPPFGPAIKGMFENGR